MEVFSHEFNYCGYQEASLPLALGKFKYTGSDCSKPRPYEDSFRMSVKMPLITPGVVARVLHVMCRGSTSFRWWERPPRVRSYSASTRTRICNVRCLLCNRPKWEAYSIDRSVFPRFPSIALSSRVRSKASRNDPKWQRNRNREDFAE